MATALKRLGQAILLTLPLLLMVYALYASLEFVPEALGRMYLWIFVYHLAPYANHADTVDVTREAGRHAVIVSFFPAIASIASSKKIQYVALAFFGVVCLTFLLFLLMVRLKGFVSYEEFAAHGV